MRYAARIVSVAFCLNLATAQAMSQESPRLLADSFDEVERQASLIYVPTWLRGLHLAAQISPHRPRLVAYTPSNWAGHTICADATTIDGRYVVKGQYTLPVEWTPHPTELDYPTKFPDPWSKTDPLASGVLISQGACSSMNDGAEHAAIPAILNGRENLQRDTENRPQLVVKLHARDTQEVVATLSFGDHALDANCEKFERPDATQFNFICRIALPQNLSGAAHFDFIRLNGGRSSKSRGASIIVPPLG